MGVKNYTFSGIRVEAMQITPPMSEDDSNELSKWIGEHNATMTIETGYYIGTQILMEVEAHMGHGLEYSFHMHPGDWLAYDGDIFFHITDDVFRKHYREIKGKKVTHQDDAVVYATGGVLNLDKLPPAKVVTGGKAHQPFVDGIRKARVKAKVDAAHKEAKDALDASERKQQAKETDRETYDRHMGLLDLDGHAEHCSYCKDSTRNTLPPAFRKALADAVDKAIADGTNYPMSFNMDRNGKVTPDRHPGEEPERNWAFTRTIKTTPRKHTTAERTDEWRPSLETLAMYYNDFTPKAKPTPKKKHTENKDAKKAYDSIHDYLNIIKDLADTDIYDIPAIRGLADRAKHELDHLHLNLKGPNA